MGIKPVALLQLQSIPRSHSHELGAKLFDVVQIHFGQKLQTLITDMLQSVGYD